MCHRNYNDVISYCNDEGIKQYTVKRPRKQAYIAANDVSLTAFAMVNQNIPNIPAVDVFEMLEFTFLITPSGTSVH